MSLTHLRVCSRSRRLTALGGRAAAHGRAVTRGRAATRRRWVLRVAVLTLPFLGATACKSTSLPRLGMPAPITKQGESMLTLWQGSWVAAFAVGAVVWGLVVWSVLFHRKRSDDLPPQVRYNLPIEVLYTVVPFIMISVLFYFTARDENFVNSMSPRPDVVVNVTGFQWSWEFQYPQYGVQVIGHPVNPAQITSYPGPELELPEGKVIRFNLTSPDVVHAFWVPAFLFKRDVIPGHPNHFQITTTTVTGTFAGRCSELCGLYHSEMLFTVKVVSSQQFQQWIAAHQAPQNASGGAK